ncbi:hypothetical protein [Vibrio diabolicus]|uniref:hypothetical protein n=1 Tax=Vibrio diabolicus TaxID=50719 RepID=UPI0021607574|nr:hypothetical protein [Vibrio diabolicus]MCS0435195.1 hypothetical protein [Vibrio diabolicus]
MAGNMIENRGDITNALVHLTKERTGRRQQDGKGQDKQYSALDVLCEILSDGEILGSTKSGFIKGNNPAVCFSETPLSALKHFASNDPKNKEFRYRYYGVAISKHAAFGEDARPVIYLPDSEAKWIPDSEKWRHVRYEYGSVDWTFEREWRKKGNFNLKNLPGIYVICWNATEVERLQNSLHKDLVGKVRGFLPMLHLNQML